ncbi:MAG: DUF547 domain-containing protein [Magnetococcales bacterium]|nr:DUF547 domain-containing protein [Magnetococcales bacterium]
MNATPHWRLPFAVAFLMALSFFGWDRADAVEPDWEGYKVVLERHVHPGSVNATRLNRVKYTDLKNDPDFAATIRSIAAFDVATLSGSREKLAFYINVYNILALKMVADHWPVKSIKDVGSLFGPVWKKDAGTVGGRTVTLDQVEHEILRPMGDPRVHMAIVCASVSCPDLRREPYVAANLDRQLDDQARQFLMNEAKGLVIEGGVVKLSRIFSWFEDDFGNSGGVMGFVRRYRDDLPKDAKTEADLPYDWSVNGE